MASNSSALVKSGQSTLAQIKLRVRHLPEQEVRDALLAGRADEQVRVRAVGRVQPGRELRVVDARRVEPSGGRVLGEQSRRAHQLGARAVRDEQVERRRSLPAVWRHDPLHGCRRRRA